MSINGNSKLNDLLSKFSDDPNKLVSSFMKILNSTDNAYQKLSDKHKLVRAENRHLKKDKEILVKSEKMASINQLSMGIAHEINNPISFILSNLNTLNKYLDILNSCEIKIPNNDDFLSFENIMNYQDNSKEIKEIFKDIKNLINESIEGGNRIKNIVRELMLLKDKKNQNVSYANVEDIIDSCISLIQRQIEHKVIIKKFYETLPMIKCYPNKLKQVFLNLILNSVDAIENKGIITIRARYEKSNIIITVTDSGKGIKTKYLNKIFDPFFTTKEVGQGMGLGLSTVYSIIKLHNGDISVNSKIKSGTTFTVYLPVGKNDLDSIHQKLLDV